MKYGLVIKEVQTQNKFGSVGEHLEFKLNRSQHVR
jgi:hypothetical protein